MSRPLTTIVLSLALLAPAGCGGEDEASPAGSEATTATEAQEGIDDAAGGDRIDEAADEEAGGEGSDPAPPPEDKPSGPAESGAADPRVTELEREAERAVRSFVAALDARDGRRACALVAPRALDAVELPEQRASCAASFAASIGYRDARGLPVWDRAEVTEVRSVELGDGGKSASVVATVVTRFADRDQPSIEDDVFHLTRAFGEWLIAKPSATLYRAVGIADIPLSALTPPR
jgi:hypothetical protein